MTETTPDLPAGTRLAHYEVLRVLGAGGMGTVGVACCFFTHGRILSDLLTRTRVVYDIRTGGRADS